MGKIGIWAGLHVLRMGLTVRRRVLRSSFTLVLRPAIRHQVNDEICSSNVRTQLVESYTKSLDGYYELRRIFWSGCASRIVYFPLQLVFCS
jgi:hypothetical protein